MARGPIQALVFDGARLVATGDDGMLHVLDVAGARVAAEGAVGTPVPRLALGDGRMASAGVDGAVRIHALPSGAVEETLLWHRRQVLGLAWAGGGVVSGDIDGRVALWDVSRARRPAGSVSAP